MLFAIPDVLRARGVDPEHVPDHMIA